MTRMVNINLRVGRDATPNQTKTSGSYSTQLVALHTGFSWG